MVLTVVGAADPAEVLSIVDEKIKPSADVQTSLILPEEPYKVVRSYTEQIMPVAVPLFDIGFKEDSTDKYATDKELICTSILLNAFLGESSALYRRLLDKKLINASFGHEYAEGLGYRSVILSGESRDPAAVSEIISEAVRELHRNGLSREDFESSKRVVYGKMIGGFDHKQSIASELISGEFTGRSIYDAVDAVADITIGDVNERLEKQLDADNCCLSVVKGE